MKCFPVVLVYYVCRPAFLHFDTMGLQKDRSPEKYAENIMKALDLLQKEVPRMLVQVVVMFDVTPLRFIQDGFLCEILQE